VINITTDKPASSHSHSQARDIDERKKRLAAKIPESYFDVIAYHCFTS
jgi:hypothetical protein